MRKLFALLLLWLPVLQLSAWKEPGTTTIYPRVGFNLSKFSGDKIYTGINTFDGVAGTIPARFKVGFTMGVEAQHQFSNALAGSIGLLYSQQGTAFKKTSDIEFDFKMKENNLIVPVMLVATTKYNIDLKLGLQPEFRVSKAFDKVLNKVSLSIPVGISYEYRNVALDLRYNIGVSHVYKEQSSYDASRGQTVMLTLGYGIDL
ncbi:MAG: outer membrane beta-barrel protein [Prevotella sp.]|nr:outer membrane beta-barrel protein [Prevotella sp.]